MAVRGDFFYTLMSTAREFFEKGEELFRKGEVLSALASFEKSCELDSSNPLCRSYLALLSATERGQLATAIRSSEEIVGQAPEEAIIYLNLGKLYLMAGRKKDAVDVLRKGVAIQQLPEIVELLESAGLRKKPVFPFLSRGNSLNKYSGILLKKLGLR
ncbi:MAG: hypothetical protein M0Z61_07125 [Nitrospiraceae bacterium]|nr:hypothetical protein [Nitrospiraceae bacterium]